MIIYNNAGFNGNNLQIQLINILSARTQDECACQCFANSSCMTSTFIGRNQTCTMFRASLDQGQIRIILGNNASIINFPNRTINTNSNSQPEIIQWLFDGNFNDVYNHYNGRLVDNNTAIWISPGYNEYGHAVYLSSNNYSLVDNYFNLKATNFTISAWIWIPYSIPLSGNDYFIIISHCEHIATDRCLHVGTVNNFLYFGFFDDDLPGNTQLNYNQWYHVAYVYDQFAAKQLVYLNGKQDAFQTPNGLYIGNASNFIIGSLPQMANWTIFHTGFIDKLTIVTRIKNDTELLDEATLVAYYSFDGTYTDFGPNQINNISQMNTSFSTNGRLNQAVVIGLTNSSYFQTRGFYYLCQSNYSYSFSMWIFLSGYGGTILQVSSPTYCRLPMIGFDIINHLTIQTLGVHGVYSTSLINGSIPLEQWTHISMTYSTLNGIQLFVNGSLVNSNRVSKDYLGGNEFCTITLGNDGGMSNSCIINSTIIVPRRFQGKIDELKIFSRELSSSEIYQLASI